MAFVSVSRKVDLFHDGGPKGHLLDLLSSVVIFQSSFALWQMCPDGGKGPLRGPFTWPTSGYQVDEEDRPEGGEGKGVI